MIEVVIALIAYQFVFAGLFFWYVRYSTMQNKDAIRAILSKDAYEFTETKLRENPPKVEEKEPEFIPVEELDDNQFAEAIKRQVNQ